MGKKAGCSVQLALVVTDENGDIISDIPGGGWYGFDRATANAMAMDLKDVVVPAVDGLIDEYNKKMFGNDYRKFWEKAKVPTR